MMNMFIRDEVLRAFGRNVARTRYKAGFSQERLTEEAGGDPAYLSDIDQVVLNPRHQIVLCLAQEFGVGVEQPCQGVKI